MPRRQPRIFAVFAALVMALLTACTAGQQQQQETLPDGTRLLADSAQAMRTVTTTHFTIDVQGSVPEMRIRSADGQLRQDGSVKGTIGTSQGSGVVEQEIVILGDKLYLRSATGPVQVLPASVVRAFYDPSVVLNPDRGIASVLASGRGVITQAREPVSGVDSYRLQVSFPPQPLSTVLPLPPKDRTGQLWIAVDGSRLVQAQFPATDGTITVRFSEFDVPVEITPLS